MHNETEGDETTPALVPKLRFPECWGAWALGPLSHVLTEYKLKNSAGRAVFSVSMEFGIVNQIELLGRSFSAVDTSHYTVARQFDVVYTRSPLKAFPFGIVKQFKSEVEAALSPLYGVFTPSSPHLGLLIEAYFESPNRSQEFLAPLCQKGAKNTLQITNTTFLSGCVPLPRDAAEQQRIADCLGSLDELVALQARKVEALKAHKKGLMQQLFPQEGETQPRLRFPEFRDAGEWKTTRLGDALRIFATYGIVTAGAFQKDGVPMVRGGDIKDGHIAPNPPRVSESISSQYKRTILQAGDVVISLVGYPGEAAVIEECHIGSNISRAVGLLRVAERLNAHFLACFLNSPQGRRTVLKPSAGSAQIVVNLKQLNILALSAPALAEQLRIADCLTSLDDLITAESTKLSALKTHKKGLMQQLFPTPAED
jgi:type I restriction enzyme S subunit